MFQKGFIADNCLLHFYIWAMALLKLPVFALNTICFPGHSIPIRVFEDRYHSLLQDCEAADRSFVVSLISRGSEVGDMATPFRVGTLVEYSELRDSGGEYFIQPRGRHRVFLENFDRESKPYLLAECRSYNDEGDAVAEPGDISALEEKISALASDTEQLQASDVQRILIEMKETLSAENYSLFLCGCLQIPTMNLQHLLESRSAEYRLKNLKHILFQV